MNERKRKGRNSSGGPGVHVKASLVAMAVLAMGCMPPQVVDFVDLDRYAGLWYEIARYPVPFDEDTVAVTATYTLLEDGTVHVLNEGLVGSLEGPPTSIEGIARVADPESNAKLLVSFDRPGLETIEGNYWVIDLAEDYAHAVVSDPLRFTLYILAREPFLEPALYDEIVARLTEQGFNPARIEPTPQPLE